MQVAVIWMDGWDYGGGDERLVLEEAGVWRVGGVDLEVEGEGRGECV